MMITAVKSTSKNYARTYIMSELEKKITTSKTDQPAQSKATENSNSKIPIKPRPPQLASRPVPRPASVNCKKPLIPQRAPNTIYSKPKQPPVPPPLAATAAKAETDNQSSSADKDTEKSSVQHLARKFSALGRNKTQTTNNSPKQVVRKISDPTGLNSTQLIKERSQDDNKKRQQSVCYNSLRLATVSEESQPKSIESKKHSHITKSASTEDSQLFPPQILISETATIKHGSQDSGIADCSNDSITATAPASKNLLTAPPPQPDHVPSQVHKHGGYLQLEYQKPTNSTIETFKIHMMEEAPATDISQAPSSAVVKAAYGSQTDDEKVQYMYYSGSQESSCTVNSTDTDGYSLMKCPNYKRLSTDTYVEINNLMQPKPDRIPSNESQQRNCKSHTMDSVRVEPGYLPANRPESIGYVDHNCNPVSREDYCEDTTDYSWNSTATLPHPKSPRKMSVIKDANGYVHEENLPPVEATALRRLIRHGNRLVNGELYSYAKVPGIILPTVNKDKPKPAWEKEKKKKSVLKRPPPIQPKSDSMRRSIMQHRYTDDYDGSGIYSSEDDNSPAQQSPRDDDDDDDGIGHSPNGFSSLDGPVFIDKFKTLETYGRERSFSEFHTLSSPEHPSRTMTMDGYVSHDLVSSQLSTKNKAKKNKKPYKLPANVTSSYATIGAPADYEVPYNSSSGGEEVIQHTSPPPSPPKPIPAPRKQLLTPAVIIEKSPRDRSKSLHDFTDSSYDMDSEWRPIRERARLVSRRRHKALIKRTFSSENLLEHNKRKELKHLDKSYGWKRCETIDTTDGYISSTEGEMEASGESIPEHSESSLSSPESSLVTKSHIPSRRVPLNDSIAKQKVNRSHSQEDLANVSPTITGYDIPRFRTKKPYVNLPPVVTANVEIGPVSFTMTTDNIYDTPRVPSTPADTSILPQGGEAECMYASGMFTHKGGMLTSSGSGVQIEIPEGAIARGKTQQVWFAVCQEIEGFSMDTVDSRIQSNSRMFEQGRNRIEVTPRVLVGPTNATFLKPIKIIIPHCVSPLHASWEFTALVRKEDTEQTDWQEVTQQILNPLWSKKPCRNTYQHTKYQMMLRQVMFSTLHPGWFVLTGKAVRNGRRTAKIMTAVVYCGKQELENKNKKLTLFVLLANNTTDDRKVTHHYIRVLQY